ncbi:caspase family protein [Vibrio fluvialis]|nr:caspase family protein [Vibrio fluvialis]MBY7963682.1 caspase family protein [Vibrio fluvialis]MBY7967843.1 caspase family protein [Vibrio fluvialis]MBY8079449.1 caspase family protein [Vibrio fluvialis]MBY8140671.1 caspase family protein [Vibrio fluvialis]
MNLAILIGVSQYENCSDLSACGNDVEIMSNIITQLDKYDDVCVISNSPKAYEAKQKITAFINKHKDSKVDELVFYYTGHGARFDDDFFYIFSDFSEGRREVSGLRNSELDGLIRNLEPELTIKVVDACFAGGNYVKSEADIKPILEKSAKENELNKLYFLHSSNSEETSLATSEYSLFSNSFFKSLTQNEGDIRYRDIMAYVADDMAVNGYPKPTFVVQAENTEIFGEVSPELIDYINKTLSVASVEEANDSEPEKDDNKSSSFIELVMKASENCYCSEEEAHNNISKIRDFYSSENWPDDILNIFDIEITELSYSIPNSRAISKWLDSNKNELYFVESEYRSESYIEKEYVKVPKKPEPVRNRLGGIWESATLATAFARSALKGDDYDYELQDVEKTRSVFKGIDFTASTPFKCLQLKFKPKYKSVENYAMTIVPVFSRKELAIFTSSEVLVYVDWDRTSMPKCIDWKVNKIQLKNESLILDACKQKIAEVSLFITSDVKAKLK